MRTRWGYLIGLAFVAAAAAWGVITGLRFVDSVDDMPRVTMPGVGELTLPAGDITFYVEPGANKFRCKLVGDAGEVALERPSGRTSYHIGEHRGVSAFTATLPRDGAYRMTCASDDHFTIAAGHLGMSIVMLVVGSLVLFGAGAAFSIVTFVRRHGKRAHAAAP